MQKYTTVGTLIRELSDFPNNYHLYLDGDKIMIGKNHFTRLPTKLERQIEKMYEQLQGVKET